MRDTLIAGLVIAVAGLVGMIPSARLVRRFWGVELAASGTGNTGAGNATKTAGVTAGIALAVADGLKGLLPVLFAHWSGLSTPAVATVGLAAVVGNNWPLVRHGRGGRGLATSVGVVVGVAPSLLVWPGLWSAVGWKIGGGPAGFAGWALLAPFALTVGAPREIVIMCAALGVAMAVRRAQGNAGFVREHAISRIVFDNDPRPTTAPDRAVLRGGLGWMTVLLAVGFPLYVWLIGGIAGDAEVVDGAWGLLVGACISELGAKWTFGELFREGAEKAGTPVRRWVALRAALVGTGVARLIPAGGAITPVAMSWASGKKGTAGAALRATILNYAGLMLATGAGVLWVWGRYSPAGLESLGPVFGVALLAAGLALVGLTTRLRIIAWMVPSRWRAKAERALSEHPLTIRSWLLLTARVVLEAITLDLTLRAFGVQLVPSQVIAAFGLSQLVGGLPGPPGGLGITEAGLMGVLAVFGISTAAALTPVLVFRVVSYWIPAAVGVIAGGMRFAAGRPAVIGEGDRVGETIKADRDGSG